MSADEAYELLFDDHAGHALRFGEAAGEGGCSLVQRAEQGADPRATPVKARQDFLENLVVLVGLHPAPHPQFLAAIRDCVHRSFFECSARGHY